MVKDSWNEPSADIYFAASLLFASKRWGNDFTITSCNLPTFLDLFALRSAPDSNLKENFVKTADAARDLLYKSSNTSSGLFPDYCNFDGTPHLTSFNANSQKYKDYGPLCATNFGMDYYLSGKDKKKRLTSKSNRTF